MTFQNFSDGSINKLLKKMKKNNQLHRRSKIFIVLVILLNFVSIKLSAQDTAITKEKLKTIADGIIKDASFQFVDQKSGIKYSIPSDAPMISTLQLVSPYNDWRYWNGVLNIAMVNLGNAFSESGYKEFVKKNIAFTFDNYGYFKPEYKPDAKWVQPLSQFLAMEELDDCGAMGGSVIEVYRFDPQKRYMEYLNKAANHILNKQDRLPDGTLVRKFPNKFTLWADDLYMSISFLSRMGELTGEKKYLDDAVQQVINFHKYLFNKNSGLMYHCYYSDVKRQGVAYWGRANGWAMLAQVDLLDRLPRNHPKRKILIELLQKQIVGLSRYQSSDGLWHQLLDKVDSYLETSCSAMFTYTIARAVNKGYIEPRYASIAKRGWSGIIPKIHSDGKIEGICAGTGTSDDLIHYYKRPTPLNDIHGIGAVLLAGMEILKLPK
jgi:rhamnogalacturonyl hydrolase YesR